MSDSDEEKEGGQKLENELSSFLAKVDEIGTKRYKYGIPCRHAAVAVSIKISKTTLQYDL